MGKAKNAVTTGLKSKSSVEPKKKAAAKKAPKAKKTKLAENGSAKAEEPKAEATEAN